MQTFLQSYARKASNKKQLQRQAQNQPSDQSPIPPSLSDQSNASDLLLSASDCVQMCSCVPQHFHVHPVVLTVKGERNKEDRNTGSVIKQQRFQHSRKTLYTSLELQCYFTSSMR